ncbi:MAG TPA: hypothetical protein VF173_03010 [Thermoanaerobaculia bacterium]|nr:hypothetical protein [Thermoanaerobaculia bacterium]
MSSRILTLAAALFVVLALSTVHEALATPTWSYFVGKTVFYGNCTEFCASVNKTCVNTCTTSRGYPNWGAEAWVAGQQLICGSVGAGQQYCDFTWDDVVGGPNRWKCCCQ